MAKNAELRATFESRAALKKQRAALQATVQPMLDEIATIEASLDAARTVTDVLDGVCLQVFRDDDDRWTDAATVGDDSGERLVHLYQHAISGGWAVRINQNKDGYARFYGGRTLGIPPQHWSYDEALTIAKRWLNGDEALIA